MVGTTTPSPKSLAFCLFNLALKEFLYFFDLREGIFLNTVVAMKFWNR